MPRAPRLDVPGYPRHVVQRGNDRQACFLRHRDRLAYLGALQDALRTCDCRLHAYVLMDNHVHLLVTPEREGGLWRMMQSLGRRYVRWFNDVHRRTGTLWEGRYKDCLVESDRYLLACQRYIELNPVRAGIAASPGDWHWSSYAANAWGKADPLLSPHPTYLALGADPGRRFEAYRGLFQAPGLATETDLIRRHTASRRALGSERFVQDISRRLGRPAAAGQAGRPRLIED